MALDGAFLHCLTNELSKELDGARIDRIYQPSKEELIFTIWTQKDTKRLYITSKADGARVNFTNYVPENPQTPPMFCMLLRKWLTGGRFVKIRQPGLERAAFFDIDCVNEMGDIVRVSLVVEIMGRHSNIILVDSQDKVIDSIKRIGIETSSVRPILPGITYSLPPKQAMSNGEDKLDLSNTQPKEILKTIQDITDVNLSKALLKVVHGLSPLVCREISHRVTSGSDTDVSKLDDSEKQKLLEQLQKVKNTILTGQDVAPYMLYKKPDMVPFEYSFITITQYGIDVIGQEINDFSTLLDEYYYKRDNIQRIKQRSQDISRIIKNTTQRLTRRIEMQTKEYKQAKDREELRKFGDLLTSNIHNLSRGAKYAEVIDYYDPNGKEIKIKLDPMLSPAENAQKYYKDYRRAQTAEKMLAKQLKKGKGELSYMNTVSDALSRAESLSELDELRHELISQGYLKPKRKSPQKSSGSNTKPKKYVYDDGFNILVGRNNLQNDKLTMKIANKNDIWLHTKDIPGSHVIIQTDSKQVPPKTLEQAAMLAALHSKASESSQVPVDYTKAKNVRKPSGARPGFVIYENNKTVFVTPDKSLENKLKDSKNI